MVTTPSAMDADVKSDVLSLPTSAKWFDEPFVANFHNCDPSLRGRAITWPSMVPETTSSGVPAGPERIREPASKDHARRPDCASAACIRPPPRPTYTRPPNRPGEL